MFRHLPSRALGSYMYVPENELKTSAGYRPRVGLNPFRKASLINYLNLFKDLS